MKPSIDMVLSPYDHNPAPTAPPGLLQLKYVPKQRWVPSRFNARTVGDDGRLIMWNTLNGAISIFLPQDRDAVIAHLSHKGVTAPLDRVGEYLSKRGFLVREKTDEMALFRYRYARQQWRNDVLQLILLASEDCNFRCVYCYEKFERGTMTPETRQGVMALVLQRAPYLRDLSISWFGGEPLYGWDTIEELGPFFKDVVDRHGIAYGQQMTTNAYLLTEERATKLLDWGCRKYQITIDGLPEDHDCKRVGRDGSPTYHVILDNLRSLKERKDNFSIDLRVNFDQQNFPRLGQFLESLSEDFGGDPRFQMRFRAVGRWGGSNDDQLSTCGVEEQRTVARELRRKAEEVNLAQEAGIVGISAPGSQVCYAARPYNFIVGATGTLMKCTIALYELDANVVGQLHPDGTLELKDENMTQWVNAHFETDPLCQNCYVLPGCQGAACPLTRVTHNQRSCCGVKSTLKQEMRYSLDRSPGARQATVSAT